LAHVPAGLALLTVPDLIHNNPIANRLSSIIHPAGIASVSNPMTNQLSALAGVFCTAIGIAYGMSFYHGHDEWLYMSIPVRLLVSSLCFATWSLAPEKVSPLLLAIMVWDGGCAAVGAYLMGDCSGKKERSLGAGKNK
jgi:hypothetical protein